MYFGDFCFQTSFIVYFGALYKKKSGKKWETISQNLNYFHCESILKWKKNNVNWLLKNLLKLYISAANCQNDKKKKKGNE